MNGKDIRRAFIATLPVMTGYLVLGLGFGVVLKAKGFGFPWALAMGAGIYAGSMQFVAADLLSNGASLIVAALTTLTVNARHLFYGISMVEAYKNTGKRKPYLIFALTDETYSLVCDPAALKEVKNPSDYYFFVSLFNHCYWVAGCLGGSLLGSIIPFDTTGIDFALTALFVTVFTEQWLGTKQHLPALIGLGASVLCLVLFGAEHFLIPAMVLIALALTLLRGKGGLTDA